MGLGNLLILTEAIYSVRLKFFIQQVFFFFFECTLPARPYLITVDSAGASPSGNYLLWDTDQCQTVFKITAEMLRWPL